MSGCGLPRPVNRCWSISRDHTAHELRKLGPELVAALSGLLQGVTAE